MALLFEPLKIREVTLKNRIVVSPMCQYSSVDGFANNWHLVHLGSRAVGGAGLVFTEATAVCAEGRITPDDLGIWRNEHIIFLKNIVDFLKDNGSVAGIQLAHAGRKASYLSPWKGRTPLTENQDAWQTLAPSAIPYKNGDPVPKEMTIKEIKDVVKYFVDATERALQADLKYLKFMLLTGICSTNFYHL